MILVNESESMEFYLRCVQESLCISVVYSFSRFIPASVICISCVNTSIHFIVFQLLNPFIFQAFLHFKQSLSMLLVFWMTNDADRCVPGWLLSAQEISIDFTAYFITSFFDLLMVGLHVLIPSVETSLVFLVIQLTVSNSTNFGLSLEVVLSIPSLHLGAESHSGRLGA